MPTFDEEREANIARNRELLAALGLDTDMKAMAPRPAPKRKQAAPKKRKPSPVSDSEDDDSDSEPKKKFSRVEVEVVPADTNGLRRSGRNAGKTTNYADDGNVLSTQRIPRVVSKKAAMATEPKSTVKRTQDPKQYGSIPGIPVGTWWETREECSKDAIHAPWVAGISPGPKGAYSVALSGGYEDDIDVGEGFTFTGSGGRDLKGTTKNPKNLRTAPQSCDQTWESAFNKALKKSSETKKPVRVIRGFKNPSVYAPTEGYRYDGLYTVEKAWQERGLNPGGFLVCKFLFKRIPGQPPLTRLDIEDAEDDEADSSVTTSNGADAESDDTQGDD